MFLPMTLHYFDHRLIRNRGSVRERVKETGSVLMLLSLVVIGYEQVRGSVSRLW